MPLTIGLFNDRFAGCAHKNENRYCLASKSRAYVLITDFTPCKLNCVQGLQQVR